MLNYLKSVCIIGLSAAIFVPTLEGDFVFDDSEAILKNADVVGSGSLRDLFVHDFWGSNITSNHSHKSYRPLTILTYRLNYYLNNKKLDAFQFKLTNLLCHMTCSLLVWQTYRLLLQERESYLDMSFLSTLLFSAHPVHVEAVSGIVGRADLLAGICFFLSFISYMKATHSKITLSKQCLYLISNFIFAILAMLCKEIGITVLAVCFSYEVIYIRRTDVLHLIETFYFKSRKSKGKKSMCRYSGRNSIIRIILLMIATILLLAYRWTIMGKTKPHFQDVDNPAAFREDIITRMMTYQYIYFLNALLLVWPQWLCFDWSMGCVPLVESPFDPRVLFIVLLYVYAVQLYSFLLDHKPRKKHKRMLLLSHAILLIPFLPASNILFTVGFVVAERLLYIPSAGFCLLVVCGLTKLAKRNYSRHYKLMYTFYLLLLVTFAVKSWNRSRDWQTEYNLFSSGLQVCPNNAKVHYNVAKTADARHQVERAIEEYKEAIRLYPKYHQAMNNLANLLKDQKRFREAENYLREAIKHKPDFAAAWMNLGIVLANTRRREESRQAYRIALAHRRLYPDCYYNLGNLYLDMELNEHAIELWLMAISMRPKHRLAWSNLLALLDNTGQNQRALQLIPTALAELPEATSIHFIVANILGKLGQFQQAEEHFMKTIELSSGNNTQAIHYANLGVLYHRWKRYEKAEEYYLKALEINPSLKSALDNISNVRKLIAKREKQQLT